ncbi:hypothetical protein A2U01_0067688, partial [Trifolium medium]|nr:hypothetical protein [Trifolium medium]
MSTQYLMIKYPLDNGEVRVLRVDQATVRRYYQASLKTGPERPRKKVSFESGAKQETMNFTEGFTDLDPREDFQEKR